MLHNLFNANHQYIDFYFKNAAKMSDDKRITEQRNGRKGKKKKLYFVKDTALRVVLYIMIILCE